MISLHRLWTLRQIELRLAERVRLKKILSPLLQRIVFILKSSERHNPGVLGVLKRKILLNAPLLFVLHWGS